MAIPLSARSNTAASAAAVSITAGAGPRTGPKNPLLVRDDVGKAKPSTYDLPHDRFAYGRPGNHDIEGAREVSMYWVCHKPSSPPENTAPDFVRFNKKAAAKVTTAKDLAVYRKVNDSSTPRYGQPFNSAVPRVVPSDFVKGFTYGKKVRPSTPIDEVISNRFADQAEDDLQRFYAAYRDEQEKSASQVRRIPQTTASRGHASTKKAHQQEHQLQKEEHFKIRKFKNIQTKIDNRRRPGSHVALLNRLQADDQNAAVPQTFIDVESAFEADTGRDLDRDDA
jgi:hypothetical protein